MEHEPMGSGTGAIVRITVPPHGAEETRTDRAGIQDRERKINIQEKVTLKRNVSQIELAFFRDLKTVQQLINVSWTLIRIMQ